MTATYDPLARHYDAVAGDGVAEAAFELGLDMGWVKIRELTYSPVKI